jgi:hypothetical protein
MIKQIVGHADGSVPVIEPIVALTIFPGLAVLAHASPVSLFPIPGGDPL